MPLSVIVAVFELLLPLLEALKLLLLAIAVFDVWLL